MTLHFLVSKLLEGMNRQNNNSDDLMPITKGIFKQILHTLLKVFRDTLLFSAALTLTYFALLNVGDLHHLRITYPIKVLRFRLFESSIIFSTSKFYQRRWHFLIFQLCEKYIIHKTKLLSNKCNYTKKSIMVRLYFFIKRNFLTLP